MLLPDHICNHLTQIPEDELLRWPWYLAPGLLLLYENVFRD